jgi:hypothetical protein
VVAKHLNQPPPRVADVATGPVPPALAEIVERCLAKEPRGRFGTMEELDAALAQVPLATPWSSERARAWWAAHPPATGDSA